MGICYRHYLLPEPRSFLPEIGTLRRALVEMRDRRWLPAISKFERAPDLKPEETVEREGYVLAREGERLVFPNARIGEGVTGEGVPWDLDADWFRAQGEDRFQILWFTGDPPIGFWPFRERDPDPDPAYADYSLMFSWSVDFHVDGGTTVLDARIRNLETGSFVTRRTNDPGREVNGLRRLVRRLRGKPAYPPTREEVVVPCACGANLAVTPPGRGTGLPGATWYPRGQTEVRRRCAACGRIFDPSHDDYELDSGWGELPGFPSRLRGGTFYRFLVLLDCEKNIPPPRDTSIRVKPELLDFFEDRFGCRFVEFPVFC